MQSIAGIARSFRLMLVQVTKQLENTARLLDAPTPAIIKSIYSAEEFIDTQKSQIEKECFTYLGNHEIKDDRKVASVRALSTIASNLERISDFAVNIVQQMQHLHDQAAVQRFPHRAYLDALLHGVGLIADALLDRDSARALQICRIENDLDQLYRSHTHDIVETLRVSREVEDPLTVMFILHYLERMGDALLNIGEAIISTVLGERFKLRQYRILDDALAAASDDEQSLTDVELVSFWGTRSGVRVGTMEEPPRDDAEPRRVLFKEGNPDKLKREKDSLQRWHELAPQLVPEVVEFHQQGRGAALLLQYLDGTTFLDLVLGGEASLIDRAQTQLETTLQRVWTDTKQMQQTHGEYISQLAGRLDDVYRAHPQFRDRGAAIDSAGGMSFEELLQRAAKIDETLPAPFTVFIHGDFNLDNIIFNRQEDSLHFVDVHRSRDMDYVQDVSVFLISDFRLPVFTTQTRTTLAAVAQRFLEFARRFADDNNDATFEARLALGLARSFITSTRFEFNRRFAETMHERAIQLLSTLIDHDGRSWDTFRVPDNILIY